MFLGVSGARWGAWRVRTWLVAALLIVCAAHPSPAAADSPLSLQLVPAELQLDANGSGHLTVLATDEGEKPLRHLHLSADGVAEVTVSGPSSTSTLHPGETRVFTVTVSEPGDAAKNLSLLSSFKAKSGYVRTLGATAKIERETTPTPESLATFEVKASLQSLRSGNEQPVFLIVHDAAAKPLELGEMIPSGPEFIKFTGLPEHLTVAPDETEVVEIKAKTDDTVEPGEHEVVFKVPATVGTRHFDLVSAQMTKVAVTGEADLLTVLGVPSILFLPGFLVIATASILWRFRLLRKEWDGAEFPLPFKEPGFWVFAIAISLLAALICKPIGLDVLGRYGLRQIIYLWLGSIGVGLVGYVLVVLLFNRWHSSRVPGEHDDPLKVLRKLDRQQLTLLRPSYPGTATPPARMFLLQPENDSRPSTWVCSQIGYTRENIDEGLDEEIARHLDTTHDAKALAEALAKGVAAKQIEVKFEGDPPTLVPKGKLPDTTKEIIARALD
jgi:hypothetical protein